MPHFVIDCSADVLNVHPEDHILEQVHSAAAMSGIFDVSDIKVRLNPYKQCLVGGESQPFIHVFANMMQGRATEQKAQLSRSIVEKLVGLFPDVSKIAMNIDEFEKATYFKRDKL
ncbi:5-carboxymethyl-2-hydroxymuconate Delta-isomerase [Franzmannia qiaohouensis]|uniref:5-carboxymethyl-2-hydroxymuconate Delta-isomerase n=1 Tax=Franzmannia qiaohouensis TaxID=1329370 RepID=A0ABU1HJW4_9GAMM|nr:5-carboxymethyl-2-hydroxymuconate Delta-isomerase [Halomonas qiaohouensis]MDR5907772.1 5-carboxymethyl-2-hydroxymuconate Delta-isomerase [Halomonas qiaohouensis]